MASTGVRQIGDIEDNDMVCDADMDVGDPDPEDGADSTADEEKLDSVRNIGGRESKLWMLSSS
jgi:hypothetical protein